MKTKFARFNRLAIVGLILFALSAISYQLWAQDAPAAPPVAKASTWQVLIAVAVPITVALLKLVIPKIPPVLLPITATVLGAGVDWLTSGHFGAGTFLGAAGVGLREIYDQIKKAANNSP